MSMKKVLILASIMSTTLLLGACGSDQPQESNGEGKTDDLGLGNKVIFYTDPSSGCKYLIFDGNKAGNIIPRMNPDGTQMCM